MLTGALVRLAATLALPGVAAAGLSPQNDPPEPTPSVAAAPAPPPIPRGSGNDECSGAVPLAGAFVTFAFDNNSATTGSYAQDNPGCEFFGYRGIERDEWFLWTAPDTGGASLSSCEGSLYDTKAAVYDTAACPPTNLLACNDDACAYQTSLTFSVTAGRQYLIQVGLIPGGFPGDGTFTLIGPGGLPPCTNAPGIPNDCCESAAAIGNGTFPLNNVGANTDGPGACGYLGADVWYVYTAACTGTAAVETCSLLDWDSVLQVLEGDTCPTGAEIACLDDACSIQTRISFPVTAGRRYTIRAGGFVGVVGIGEIRTSCEGTSCPCDWNDSGTLNSQDFFDFLSSFFGGGADVNGDGVTNSQDFFDFLGCFFMGCP